MRWRTACFVVAMSAAPIGTPERASKDPGQRGCDQRLAKEDRDRFQLRCHIAHRVLELEAVLIELRDETIQLRGLLFEVTRELTTTARCMPIPPPGRDSGHEEEDKADAGAGDRDGR